MDRPIIDPSTLTDEQREAIRAIYAPEYEYVLYYTKKMKSATIANKKFYCKQREIVIGRIRLFHKLFGVNMFEKGENNDS